jgi:hypothetical protein
MLSQKISSASSPPAESAITTAAEDATYELVDGSGYGLHQLSFGFARAVIFPEPASKVCAVLTIADEIRSSGRTRACRSTFRKSHPNAALQFEPNDRASGDHY